MKINFVLFILSILFILSCDNKENQQKNAPQNLVEDFSEYKLTPIGNDIWLAEKTDASGLVKEKGYVVEGQRNGMWSTYGSDGRIKTLIPYLKGQVYGTEITFTKMLQISNFVEKQGDIKHGIEGSYRNGRPKEEISYSYGELDGISRYYFTSGREQGKIQRMETYKQGQLDGPMKYYNPEGKITLEYEYRGGEKISGGMVDE